MITCICGRQFSGEYVNSRHKNICQTWQEQVGSEEIRPCLCGHKSTSSTQMKRHLAGCTVWKKRDRKKVRIDRLMNTYEKNWGIAKVISPFSIPKIKERIARTNLEKYGAENPFSKESSVFEKVQKSLEGKRPIFNGGENPFFGEDGKELARKGMLRKYGKTSPQQVKEIREKTLATNLERYGAKQLLSIAEIREKIKETCEEKYGGPAPSCSPEILEKQRQTNLDKYGVEWTNQDDHIRAKQINTQYDRYGGYFFASEDGKAKIKHVLVKRYGGSSPLQNPVVFAKFMKTCAERYGYPFYMQNPKLCSKVLNNIQLPGPNKLEQNFNHMFPQLLYTGNGSYWKYFKELKRFKNPDFIVPGPVAHHPRKTVTKVVELFGTYWHSEKFTGKANEEHAKEIVSGASCGVNCLVIWEYELEELATEEIMKLVETFLKK